MPSECGDSWNTSFVYHCISVYLGIDKNIVFYNLLMLQALVKRSPASYEDGTGSSSGPAAFGVEPLLPSSLRRRPSSPSQVTQMVSELIISLSSHPC